MTVALPPERLRDTFRRQLGAGEQEAFARRQRELREQRQERDRAEGDTNEIVDALASALTSSEIETFKVELDHYDEATVIALQENTLALADIERGLNELLMQAYVLPDGRRVFKSEDGEHVFDEHGAEVDHAIIDPAMIPDDLPTWEAYRPLLDQQAQLLQEREELLDYQHKLDDARERLDSGEMTRTEYDELREQLTSEMPDAVRAHVEGMSTDADHEPDAETGVADDAALDLRNAMIPTGMAPPQM